MKESPQSQLVTSMQISVIIPTWNEGPKVRRAVQSAWAAGALEVIVADGGSQDDTVEIAASCQSRIVQSPRGRALQQNAGARVARGEVLLFQHADCWFSPQALEQIAATLTTPDRLAGAFRQHVDAPGPLYRWIERGNAARVRLLGLAYGDQGIFVRRRTFERLGGFPPVPLMEDVLLMQRLRPLGRLSLLPGPIHVSPRRWQRHGIVRQTLRNWALLTAFHMGAPPDRLARFYPDHRS